MGQWISLERRWKKKKRENGAPKELIGFSLLSLSSLKGSLAQSVHYSFKKTILGSSLLLFGLQRYNLLMYEILISDRSKALHVAFITFENIVCTSIKKRKYILQEQVKNLLKYPLSSFRSYSRWYSFGFASFEYGHLR